MTNTQKDRIAHMRAAGKSYAAIAGALSISENTVKSYCRRNNLGAGSIAKLPVQSEDACSNCGEPLTHTPGAKKKRFCSDNCRMRWWNIHPEAVNRKAVYRFVCPACGSEFESYGNARRKYCSRTCFGLARRAADG